MEFAVIVWSTLAAFIASAITAILVWWMKQGRIHWEQHSARDFWATDDGTVSIVLSKSAEPQFTKAEAESDTVEVERRINSHTAMALSRILEFLPQLDVKVARIVDPATDDVKSVQKGNIVVLGGPLANPLARELATKEAVSFPWWWHDPDNPRAICRHPPKKGSSDYYDANVDRNGDFGIVRQDAGVVAKIRNPWARRKWIFLMAGNYGAGCRAAVDAATHYPILDRYHRKDGHDFRRPLSFVVMASFDGLAGCLIERRSRVVEVPDIADTQARGEGTRTLSLPGGDGLSEMMAQSPPVRAASFFGQCALGMINRVRRRSPTNRWESEALDRSAQGARESRPLAEADRQPPTVFVIYSNEDACWCERLQVHLKALVREGSVDLWDDTRVQTGEDWRNGIGTALSNARIAILLVSADFLASGLVASKEFPPLLEAARTRGVQIVPVIVGSCRFTESSIGRFDAVNPPDRPLAKLMRQEAEGYLVAVSRDVKRAVGSMAVPAGSLAS